MLDEEEFTLPEILTQRDTIIDALSGVDLSQLGFVAQNTADGIAQNLEALNNVLSESYITLNNQVGVEQFINDVFKSFTLDNKESFLDAIGVPAGEPAARIQGLNNILNQMAFGITPDQEVIIENEEFDLVAYTSTLPNPISKFKFNEPFIEWYNTPAKVEFENVLSSILEEKEKLGSVEAGNTANNAKIIAWKKKYKDILKFAEKLRKYEDYLK